MFCHASPPHRDARCRYNPLGNTSTFLNVEDVGKAVEGALGG